MNFLNKDPKLFKECEICNKEFTLVRIRHRCKRCYRVICGDCGTARIKIMAYDQEKKHKVCPVCDREHSFQSEFITINQTSWGKLSNVGRKWLQACQPKKAIARSPTESYAHYLALAKHPTTKFVDFPVIDRDVMEGRSKRSTFNYSMQEFLYHNQKGVDEHKIMEMTANVLKAYCMKFPTLGYTQGMSYMTVFLLSLMDEESAFWMLGYIVSTILPDNFYASSRQGVPLMGYQQEKFVIWEISKEVLEMDENTADKVQTFLEINGPALLVPLFVNYLTFEVLYETWNQMLMTRSFMIFRKMAIKLVQVLIPNIRKKALINPPDAQGRLTRRVNRDEFNRAQKIEISEEKVRELGEIFRKDYSSQWMSNQSHIYHTLQKITHFSKKEIVELQQEFNKYLQPMNASDESSGTDPANYGIRKEDFKKIMTEVVAKDEEKQGFLMTFDLDRMFRVFDVDHSDMIDFKEFLISLSMLMRGSLEERAEFAFHVFDVGNKGHLTAEEFQQYLSSIVQAAVISNQGNLTPFFKDDLKKFEDTMMALIKEKEQIAFMDIKTDLLLHDLIKYCDMTDEARTRGETILKITSTLNENPLEFKRSYTNEKITEQAAEFEEDQAHSKASQFSNENQGLYDNSLRESQEKVQVYKEEETNIGSQREENTIVHQYYQPENNLQEVKEIISEVTTFENPIQSEVYHVESPKANIENEFVSMEPIIPKQEVVIENIIQSEPKPVDNSKVNINNEFLSIHGQITEDKKLAENRKSNMEKKVEKSNENCQLCNQF